ncbi:MAG: Ppx/GppA family phosphatase [Burkholderiales bacterium]|nr:Ppx/GppA family phosphatase [Burkholderiales bacterium]
MHRQASEPFAAVDLGSNSFRLLIAREDGGQIVPISTHREGVRLAGGLDDDNALSKAKIEEACAALSRFRERLAAIPRERIRAVATSTYRVARNGEALLQRSEQALGLPIDIISGPEEARLIYLGCAHTLPWSEQERLIVDIGGGSTEFIVGRRYDPELTESFPLGAVTLSQHFFPGATVTAGAFRKAEVFVRSRLEVLQERYKQGWDIAYGSSGTIRAIHEIITENGFGTSITLEAMVQLRSMLIDAGHMNKVELAALKPSRAPVLPGGLAILLGLMQELNVSAVEPAEGALRLGVAYDMLYRSDGQSGGDPRTATVARLQRRYGVDAEQARRVDTLAQTLWLSLGHREPDSLLGWAAAVHEIGMAIAHEDYHRHSAYVLEHSDIYGFSEQERAALALLVLGHTGSLKKLDRGTLTPALLPRLVCLRLAALFSHGRADTNPAIALATSNESFVLAVNSEWLGERPLTAFLLEEEVARWTKFGVSFAVHVKGSAG